MKVEILCKDVVFHFNKKHLDDPTIPMWVLKAKGETYYVNHVSCDLPWTTKETPDNVHTKGSIKVKKCYLTIDNENCALLTQITPEIIARLNRDKPSYKLITNYGKKLKDFLLDKEHGPVIQYGGICGTKYYVTEVYDQKIVMLARLVGDIRALMPNEEYYSLYEEQKMLNRPASPQ